MASVTSRLALGTMTVSGRFNGLYVVDREPARAREALELAFALGCRDFDAAPIYARGEAERDLGCLKAYGIRVWTKVGIDIAPPLPALDYSLGGMRRSLQGSLARLGREAVHGVLVHNPGLGVLKDHRDDLEAFAAWALERKLASVVGVSLVTLAVLAKAGIGSWARAVMAEARDVEQSAPAWTQLGAAAGCRVLRSPFAAGRLIPETDDPAPWLVGRLRALASRFEPDVLVAGCSSPAQVADLAECWRDGLRG